MIDADLQAAFEHTFPLYEMARTRYLSVEMPANPNRGVNRLVHRRALADAKNRAVTTPNNDTLYSSAWLDLAAGPIELTVPPMAGRYWSFHFMDAYSGTAELIGSRNAGSGDLRLWVVHAGDARPAPPGVRIVRLPTRDVWLLVRILVDDSQDALAVHKLQDAITLRVAGDAVTSGGSFSATASTTQNAPVVAQPSNPIAPKAITGSPLDGGNYLNVVNSMLARNPVPGAVELLARWQPLGVVPGAMATPQAGALWTAALPDLNASIKGGVNSGARQVQGWQYPDSAVGVYGRNDRLRAAVALGGLGALPTQEAVYLSALADAQGQPLTGLASYRVKIGAGGIAAQAFWSLSMYQLEPDGRLFFVANPALRYAVGDRTPGLVKAPDGAMEIVVQHGEPAAAADRANWLPAPAGAFRLMLRAYLPSSALRDGQAPLPRVERAP